jgi:hypothetical protein
MPFSTRSETSVPEQTARAAEPALSVTSDRDYVVLGLGHQGRLRQRVAIPTASDYAGGLSSRLCGVHQTREAFGE